MGLEFPFVCLYTFYVKFFYFIHYKCICSLNSLSASSNTWFILRFVCIDWIFFELVMFSSFFICLVFLDRFLVIVNNSRIQLYRHISFYYASLYHASQIILYFTNWRLLAILHQASLSAPFFNSIHHFVSLLHFAHSYNVANIITVFIANSNSIIFVIVLSELRFYYCKRIMTCWNLR